MTHDTTKNLSIADLLRRGKLSDLQNISINCPQLRAILLQWRGLRQTAFFKRRLKFYRHFAKKTGLRKFTPEVKNQMRDEFAREHCLTNNLKRAYTAVRAETLCNYKMTCDTAWFLKRRQRGRWGFYR